MARRRFDTVARWAGGAWLSTLQRDVAQIFVRSYLIEAGMLHASGRPVAQCALQRHVGARPPPTHKATVSKRISWLSATSPNRSTWLHWNDATRN